MPAPTYIISMHDARATTYLGEFGRCFEDSDFMSHQGNFNRRREPTKSSAYKKLVAVEGHA